MVVVARFPDFAKNDSGNFEGLRSCLNPAGTESKNTKSILSLMARMTPSPVNSVVLAKGERAAVCSGASDAGELLVPQLVARRAASSPNAIALAAGSEVLTYEELDRQANRLAHLLRDMGVGPETVVAVHLERSPAMVMVALAILKAGGAYLPLDEATPSERLAFMLQDAGIPVLVTRSRLIGKVPPGKFQVLNLDHAYSEIKAGAAEAPSTHLTPQSLAYVIFTSGSTGQPKGVEITHAGLQNLVRWHWRAFQVTSGDRASHQSGLGFDAAVWEVWPYLAVGASVYFPDEEIRTDAGALRDWLVLQKITITFLPTVLAEALLLLDWPPQTALRILLTGADRLFRRPSAKLPFQLVNNYGPTECTVVATSATVTPAESGVPSIGRPIDNIEVYIFDEEMKPVEPGAAGELYLGGIGLARGYRNHPELTAQRFFSNASGAAMGKRLYRTGDLVRQLPNGEIEFLGRLDDQIKIRGYRIEPGEIVAALNSHAGVASSLVVARADGSGEKRLIAYLLLAGDSRPAPASLRSHLQKQIPDYMIPTQFVAVNSFPLNASGKIDRAVLPAPDQSNTLPDEEFVAPQSIVEMRLAEIIASLLHLDRVGTNDNFFLLGGHSLLGTQLLTRIGQSFGVEMSLLSLFDHPTLAGMSSEIERLILDKIASTIQGTESRCPFEIRVQGND
jgi:amino acid adenylation domain-containing protein